MIILTSSFVTGSFGVVISFERNTTYDNWGWILVRSNGGEWKHVTHGY